MNPEEAKTLIESTENMDTTFFGTRTSTIGVEEHVGVDDTDRPLHTMVTGPTGTGKTNLLLTLVLQDVQKGAGATFLNPKGGVIDEIIAKLPEERLDDVIYVNPGHDRCPGINLLEPEIAENLTESSREMQRKIVVSNLMALFRRLSEDVGERWPRNLRSLLTAHVSLNVSHGERNTLMDVYECVEDNEKLVDLINRVPDQVTRKQLEEVQGLGQRERQPLLRRLSDLLENKIVRRIITQPESSISFRDALRDSKVVLVDAQGGNVGDWAARIIGSVILTKLWSAAAARNTVAEDQRTPFHIHVDEVQEFVSEADQLRRMLSQCREFNVSLTVATQYLDDLDPTLTRAILNNTMTKAVFSPGASEDLSTYTRVMNGLSKAELGRLGKYQPAIQRPAERELPEAVIVDTYPPWKFEAETVTQRKQALLEQHEKLEDGSIDTSASTGDVAAAGGETHETLLREAKKYLEFEKDAQVNILFQDGAERPDGHIIKESTVSHLEAEHSTLSKPEKVLTNLERALEEDRECVFVVENGNVERLESILDETDTDQYRILALSDLGVVEP